MDKLLSLYEELENTFCPYTDEIDRDIDYCELMPPM